LTHPDGSSKHSFFQDSDEWEVFARAPQSALKGI
jgi:hypothetical protein